MALQTSDNHLSLSECLRGLIHCDPQYANKVVSGIAMDTRQLRAGYIFVATQGISQHGIEFLASALDAEPSAVIVQCRDNKPELSQISELLREKARAMHIPLLTYNEDGAMLAALANRVYDSPSRQCRVIGITGTNGKTSCAHYLAQAIASASKSGFKTALIGTLGNGFYGQLSETAHTTPDLFSVHRCLREFCDAGATHVVMEVSSHGLDQGRVDGVAFESAVFTNLTQDHLDYHADMREYGLAKQKLFVREDLGAAIINADDDYAEELIRAVDDKVDLIIYSAKGSATGKKRHEKYVTANAITLKHDGMTMQIQSYKGDFDLDCQLMGRFNVSNLLVVCAYLLHNGFEIDRIQEAVANLAPVPGRMQLVTHAATSVVAIIDYAHTPDALEKALIAAKEHLHASTGNQSGRLCVVFGCGGDRDPGKRPLMGQVAAAAADRVIVTDDNPRTESAQAIVADILPGLAAHPDCSVIHQRQQAIDAAIRQAQDGDVVLIAGKGHEDYQIVGREKRSVPCDAELAQAAFTKMATGGVA